MKEEDMCVVVVTVVFVFFLVSVHWSDSDVPVDG